MVLNFGIPQNIFHSMVLVISSKVFKRCMYSYEIHQK